MARRDTDPGAAGGARSAAWSAHSAVDTAEGPAVDIVLEVLEGCGEAARREAERLGPVDIISSTELRLCTRDLTAVRALRCVVSAYESVIAPTRRPTGILETSVMQDLTARIRGIRRATPRTTPFTGIRIAAAGAGTPVMRRIAEELSERSGLPATEDGNLLVRIRRADPGIAREASWEVLLRTTPRPLSARAWRVVDYPGAVNATIAASILDLLDIGADDEVLDMTCGSGTFLVEQLAVTAPARAVGVDLSEVAIDAARAHQRAARHKGRVEWVVGDVLTTPLDPVFTRILSNPPWGELHGEHAENLALHGALLRRAAELAAPGARMGVLTHEIRRMHTVLEDPECGWSLMDEHRFFQKGHHPRLFRLRRRASRG
ncbi:methyltransferase [Brachybacterium sp. AOP25-B2-12]|uniref:methyltransferase n=1 Tax=Brachybacterium sp. AOP25-B2-12 TaxID=3457710 RepID=UPI0040341DAA